MILLPNMKHELLPWIRPPSCQRSIPSRHPSMIAKTLLQTFFFVLFGKGRTVSRETFLKKSAKKQTKLGGKAGAQAAAAALWWQSKRRDNTEAP